MVMQFKSSLFFLALLVGLMVANAYPAESKSPCLSKTKSADSGLTVTKTSLTSVSLSWDAWPGSGNYNITVKNLTTNQVEQSFSTSSLTSNVSGLTIGSAYRFEVEKAGYVIAEDVLM